MMLIGIMTQELTNMIKQRFINQCCRKDISDPVKINILLKRANFLFNPPVIGTILSGRMGAGIGNYVNGDLKGSLVRRVGIGAGIESYIKDSKKKIRKYS